MKRKVDALGQQCGTCAGVEWYKAEHQLFKTSRQRGKWTTEEVHAKWRAPEWMVEVATQGGSLKELDWGWEVRASSGEKPTYSGV